MNNFKELAFLVDEWLKDYLSSRNIPEFSRTASQYVLLSGGKRVRPVLSLLVADMLGVSREQVKNICLAVEILHVASLVHDDLPALDDDDIRRGQAACHNKFGEGVAIVLGDRLIAMAFEVISSDRNIPPNIRADLLSSLAQTTEKLCDGQILDLFSQGKSLESESSRALSPRDKTNAEKILTQQHELKTAALIQFAAQAPAHFLKDLDTGGRASEVLERLGEFGSSLGLLFQITDDVLDSDSESGTATAEHELTYVSVYGLEKAKQLAQETHSRALESMSCFGDLASGLKELADQVLNRTA